MSFTSSTKVKYHLNISGTTFDNLIAQLILQVDDMITKETGVATGSDAVVTVSNEIADAEEIYVGQKYRIRTKYHPITEITKIEYRNSDGSWAEYEDETEASIEYEGDSIYTKYLVSNAGARELRLSYKAGYATASVPDDLGLAAILICAHLFNTRNLVGIANQSVLGLSQTMDKADFLYVKRVLTQYKKVYAL